jgi:hypothetical protein
MTGRQRQGCAARITDANSWVLLAQTTCCLGARSAQEQATDVRLPYEGEKNFGFLLWPAATQTTSCLSQRSFFVIGN